MKKLLLLSCCVLFLSACGGVKKTQESINIGNYDFAINKSLKNLSSNKTKKGHQPYILLLEQAFKKNAERELQQISFLQKEGNPASYEAIYNAYMELKLIQERIRPILPLQLYKENRQAKFSFVNYNDQILSSKKVLSDYLYSNAQKLLGEANTKTDYRKVFDDLKYLNGIDPGKGNTVALMNEAHSKGMDYVRVSLINNTEQTIPSRLEEDLLAFGTYDLDGFWTQYHTAPNQDRVYDYDMLVSFDKINISPERIREKEIIQEKEIEDGYTYARDSNGDIAMDSLGHKIKIPILKKVQCKLSQFIQNKEVNVIAMVKFKDLKTGQLLESYPLSSTFVFEHGFATYNGNILALEDEFLGMTKNKEIPFPSNEQMVYDTGENLKAKLKSILIRNRFH